MSLNGKRILVPVNGSPASEAGFLWVCGLLQRVQAELHAIYITELPLEFEMTTEFVMQDHRGEGVLERIERLAAEHRCHVRAQLLQARHAGPAIVQEALDRRMDLIVLGIPHQKGIGLPAVNSTASFVLGNAPCEVVCYREPVPNAVLS